MNNPYLKLDTKKRVPNRNSFFYSVGVAGFEPATSSSQTRRDNRATLHPEILLKKNIAERQGFEPWVPVAGYDDLANRSFRPLRHLSYSMNFLKIRSANIVCYFLVNKPLMRVFFRDLIIALLTSKYKLK